MWTLRCIASRFKLDAFYSRRLFKWVTSAFGKHHTSFCLWNTPHFLHFRTPILCQTIFHPKLCLESNLPVPREAVQDQAGAQRPRWQVGQPPEFSQARPRVAMEGFLKAALHPVHSRLLQETQTQEWLPPKNEEGSHFCIWISSARGRWGNPLLTYRLNLAVYAL